MKFSFVLFALIIFSSCHVYRMYDGASKAVQFTADTSVFREITYAGKPVLSYLDLANLNGDFSSQVNLKRNEPAEAIISHATLFYAVGRFLVFPGEKITVSQRNNGDFIFSVPGNEQRSAELTLLNTFSDVDLPDFIIGSRGYSLDTMAVIEKEIKAGAENILIRVNKSFDSLLDATNASNRFRAATKYYAASRHTFPLFHLYYLYKDSLVSHGIFKQKNRELLPAFNQISNSVQLGYNISDVTDFSSIILPCPIYRVKDAEQFEADYMEIEKSFTGFMKDYFLSRLMYYASLNKVAIKPGYLDKYKSESGTSEYHKIVYAILADKKTNAEKNTNGNYLLSLTGNKNTSLDELVNRHKGKVILLDFMASWCAPCREDMPALEKLRNAYSNKDVVFLNISIDKQIQSWRKFMYANSYEKENSFLLTDLENSPFAKEYKITTIPRYMVLDANGKVINSDAQRPVDKGLKALIDSFVQGRIINN
jgi:thiol-disulfide isomerase/thioredoxin